MGRKMENEINADALKSEIREAVITRKANACPIMVRLAWHASGTFDKKDNSGGSDGATMRFQPEAEDPANAGLSIPRDILQLIKHKYPQLSYADLWTLAGCAAIGRLPDASQGAQHLRDVFYRMGFNDQEIVC